MGTYFSWNSPSSAMVLSAALEALADLGCAGLTVAEIQARAGAAGALVEEADLEAIVVVAMQRVRLFREPEPAGSLRADLRALLDPWLGPRGPDERAVVALLSAAECSPRLRAAVQDAFDRPLAQAVGTLLARALAERQVLPHRVHTLNWILRGLALNRLRATDPRTHVDLDELVDYLLAGLALDRGHDSC
jgi:AcrR family transcriptional regulator